MAMDMQRMNKRREEVKRTSGKGGGDLWTIEEGETKVYVHPQSYPDDDHELTRGYNFVEVVMHYGVGGKRGGQVCHDPVANPIILHPLVQKFLAERKNPFEITKKTTCAVCTGIADGDIAGEQADRQKGETKWIFGLTPMFYRRQKEDEWSKRKFDPRVHIAGVTVFNGLTGEMIDLAPVDVTDPEAAVLLKFIRTGTKFDNTEYEVKADAETVRTPLKLDKGQRRIIGEATGPGGACDLFKVVANLMKSPVELKALIVGVKVEDDAPADGEDGEHKECFGLDYEANDKECKECPEVKECAAACDGGGDAGEEEEEKPAREEPADGGGEEEQSGNQAEGREVDESEKPPKCYETWEDCDDCKSCSFEDDCKEATQGPDDEAAAGADGGGEAEPPADDPDLSSIEEEANRLAAEGKSRKAAAARGKAAGGKAGRGGKKK